MFDALGCLQSARHWHRRSFVSGQQETKVPCIKDARWCRCKTSSQICMYMHWLISKPLFKIFTLNNIYI